MTASKIHKKALSYLTNSIMPYTIIAVHFSC